MHAYRTNQDTDQLFWSEPSCMLFFGYASREDSGETSQYDQIMQKKSQTNLYGTMWKRRLNIYKLMLHLAGSPSFKGVRQEEMHKTLSLAF